MGNNHHPAQFSPSIVSHLRSRLLERYPDFWGRPRLHDCCAGKGERLALIAGDEFDYSGTELEESFIANPRIKHGDATDPATYPTCPHVIVTSVVYPNGIADHAVSNDDSTRNTYRKAIEKIEGADRELHENNQGRYGYRGTKWRPVNESLSRWEAGKRNRRDTYWHLADLMVKNWTISEGVYLNVSDFVHHTDHVEPVVGDWITLLQLNGFTVHTREQVDTPRLRYGENHGARVDGEAILFATHGRDTAYTTYTVG